MWSCFLGDLSPGLIPRRKMARPRGQRLQSLPKDRSAQYCGAAPTVPCPTAIAARRERSLVALAAFPPEPIKTSTPASCSTEASEASCPFTSS